MEENNERGERWGRGEHGRWEERERKEGNASVEGMTKGRYTEGMDFEEG